MKKQTARIMELGKTCRVTNTELYHYVGDLYRSRRRHLVMADGVAHAGKVLGKILPVVFKDDPNSPDLITIKFQSGPVCMDFPITLIFIEKSRIAAEDLGNLLGLTFIGSNVEPGEELMMRIFLKASNPVTYVHMKFVLDRMLMLNEHSASVN